MATAISIPISIVAKHFPLNTRTIALGIVTAAGSFGYFVSPIYTRFALIEFGWNTTLLIFAVMIIFGLMISFLTTPIEETKDEEKNDQTAIEAIKKHFQIKVLDILPWFLYVVGILH